MKNHLFCFVQKMQMKNHLLNIGILAVLIFIGSPGRGAISIGILVVQVQFAVLQQLCTVEMTRFVGNGTDRFGAVSRFYPDLVVVFENQL